MKKTIFLTGIVFGVLAIVLGAFAAHGLEKVLDTEAIQTFETGVKYQMYHALLLLILANVNQLQDKDRKRVYYLIVIGVILFSFSIYALATNDMTSFDFKSIGFVTPLGGTILILAWVLLGYRTFRQFK